MVNIFIGAHYVIILVLFIPGHNHNSHSSRVRKSLIIAQIEKTLLQFPTVTSVVITVDGEKDPLQP